MMKSFICLIVISMVCAISWTADAAPTSADVIVEVTVDSARPEPVKKTIKIIGERVKERPFWRRFFRRRVEIEIGTPETMLMPTPAKHKMSPERAKKMKKWDAMTPDQKKKAIADRKKAHKARHAAWAKANPEKAKKMAERRKKWDAMTPDQKKKAMEARKARHKGHKHHNHTK